LCLFPNLSSTPTHVPPPLDYDSKSSDPPPYLCEVSLAPSPFPISCSPQLPLRSSPRQREGGQLLVHLPPFRQLYSTPLILFAHKRASFTNCPNGVPALRWLALIVGGLRGFFYCPNALAFSFPSSFFFFDDGFGNVSFGTPLFFPKSSLLTFMPCPSFFSPNSACKPDLTALDGLSHPSLPAAPPVGMSAFLHSQFLSLLPRPSSPSATGCNWADFSPPQGHLSQIPPPCAMLFLFLTSKWPFLKKPVLSILHCIFFVFSPPSLLPR